MTGGYGALRGWCAGAGYTRVRGHTQRRRDGLELHLRASAHTQPSHRRTHLPFQTSQRPLQGPGGAYAGAENRGGAARSWAEMRPRSGGERRGAPASHPGCLSHLASDVFKTAFPTFRRWQLQGKGPAKRIGHPGTSWLLRGGGARGHPPSQESNCSPGSRSPPTPTLFWEPSILNWPAEEFTPGIRNPIAFDRRFAPTRDTLAKGRDRRRDRRLLPAPVWVSLCAIMLTLSPFLSQDKADLDRTGFCGSTLLLLNTPWAWNSCGFFFFLSFFLFQMSVDRDCTDFSRVRGSRISGYFPLCKVP